MEDQFERICSMIKLSSKHNPTLGNMLLLDWLERHGILGFLYMLRNKGLRCNKKIELIAKAGCLPDDLVNQVKEGWSSSGRGQFKGNHALNACNPSKKKLHRCDLVTIAIKEIDKWGEAQNRIGLRSSHC